MTIRIYQKGAIEKQNTETDPFSSTWRELCSLRLTWRRQLGCEWGVGVRRVRGATVARWAGRRRAVGAAAMRAAARRGRCRVPAAARVAVRARCVGGAGAAARAAVATTAAAAAALLLYAPAPAAAGHCYALGTCEACSTDMRGSPCGWCKSTSRCGMSWDACTGGMVVAGMSCEAPVNLGAGEPFFTAVADFMPHDNPAQYNYGVAVTDWDGDGAFEAVVAGFQAPNKVVKYDAGSGTYVDLLASGDPVDGGSTVADASRKAIGVAACDVDGDGREELYVLNTDAYSGKTVTSDRLFARAASAADGWRDVFELPVNQDSANFVAGRSCACVDRFGKGEYEVMVANYGGPMRLYQGERSSAGDLTVRDVASEAGVARTTGGRALASARLVAGTPGMDIFANNEMSAGRDASNFLFKSNGDGTFSDVAEVAGILDPRHNGRGVAVFDANDDGLLDVAAGNWQAEHRLWLQNDDGTFEDVATADMASPSRVRTVIAADFDNDGRAEIFFNNIPGDNRLFSRSDSGEWMRLNIGDAAEADGLGTGAAVGDFDEDGVLELLISHGESGAQPLTMYKAAAPDRHWLRIVPLTAAGAPARGATVSLAVEGGATTTYAIDAGSGYLCQMEPVAHFGLGNSGITADDLRVSVTWPGGETIAMGVESIDTTVQVPFPGSSGVPHAVDGGEEALDRPTSAGEVSSASYSGGQRALATWAPAALAAAGVVVLVGRHSGHDVRNRANTPRSR